MKKLVFLLVLIALCSGVDAQQQAKVRVGFNSGINIPGGGLGLGGNVDIRYNLMDNINMGVMFSGDAMVKDVFVDEFNLTASITASAISSILVTSDYYFNDGYSMFAPFLGGGLGVYTITNVSATVDGTYLPSAPSNLSTYTPDKKVGALIRGGFELGRARLGLECFLVPKSNVYDVVTGTTGVTSNSFLKLSLGFYLGGGRWRK